MKDKQQDRQKDGRPHNKRCVLDRAVRTDNSFGYKQLDKNRKIKNKSDE